MLKKVRDNIFIGDRKVTPAKLKEAGVTVIEFVYAPSAKLLSDIEEAGFVHFVVRLYLPEEKKNNKPHVKDIACHIPKHMISMGETVAIIGRTGLVRAAFVATRAICEIETRSIYEVFTEIKEVLPDKFNIGRAYL